MSVEPDLSYWRISIGRRRFVCKLSCNMRCLNGQRFASLVVLSARIRRSGTQRIHPGTVHTGPTWFANEENPMPAGNLLYYALVALVIALVAAFLGFGGIAGAAAGIAQILFYIFLIIFVVILIMNFVGRGRGPTV